MIVGVVAVVRDEAECLPRMLNSVLGFVDLVVIVDTGSTDDTIDVAIQLCLDQGVELSCHQRPWVNFGCNLTEAFSIALGRADWLMRLDADMTVEYVPEMTNWLSDEASADAYNIIVHDHGTDYRLPLLMRGDRLWRYFGPTHEVLDTFDRVVCDLYPESLSVTHHADGSNRVMKHQRDIELLAEGCQAGDSRSTYYTAQAHQCLGDHATALALYDRRASMPGWEEEAWHAQYQAAVCSVALDHPNAPDRLLAAYRRRPERSEPLVALEEWCRRKRAHAPPSGDCLFIETEAYH